MDISWKRARAPRRLQIFALECISWPLRGASVRAAGRQNRHNGQNHRSCGRSRDGRCGGGLLTVTSRVDRGRHRAAIAIRHSRGTAAFIHRAAEPTSRDFPTRLFRGTRPTVGRKSAPSARGIGASAACVKGARVAALRGSLHFRPAAYDEPSLDLCTVSCVPRCV